MVPFSWCRNVVTLEQAKARLERSKAVLPASLGEPVSQTDWEAFSSQLIPGDSLYEYRSDEGSERGFAIVVAGQVMDSLAVRLS